jgi:hypothetical protein
MMGIAKILRKISPTSRLRIDAQNPRASQLTVTNKKGQNEIKHRLAHW